MYAEMRDLNFRAVGMYLSREAKKITAAYEVCPSVCISVGLYLLCLYGCPLCVHVCFLYVCLSVCMFVCPSMFLVCM